MRCFFCKGHLSPDTTVHVVNTDKGVIIIRNVPCEKCDQCGETVYTGTIVKQLEAMVSSLHHSMAEVVIVSFANKVA